MGNMFTIAGQSNLDAARVAFHGSFLESLESTSPDPLEQLFTEVQSSSPIEEYNWMGGVPGFEEWKGDRKLGELTAYKFRLENKDWSSGIRVHQNQFKDDKLGLIRPQVDELAVQARQHRSELMSQLLINGFDGLPYPTVSNGLSYDGAFFFSTSHQAGTSTQSNRLTTALSATSLATAEQMLMEMKTQDGSRRLRLKGTHLIVGPKLADTARRLLSQDFVATSAGTAAESNIWKGRFQPIITPELTGTYDDWWFLVDLSRRIRPGLFQMREEITTSAVVGDQGGQNDSTIRFARGEMWFGAEARYNVGYLAWQTIIGSKVA